MTESATHDERSAAIDTHGRLNLAMWTIDWTARNRSRENRVLLVAAVPEVIRKRCVSALTDDNVAPVRWGGH